MTTDSELIIFEWDFWNGSTSKRQRIGTKKEVNVTCSAVHGQLKRTGKNLQRGNLGSFRAFAWELNVSRANANILFLHGSGTNDENEKDNGYHKKENHFAGIGNSKNNRLNKGFMRRSYCFESGVILKMSSVTTSGKWKDHHGRRLLSTTWSGKFSKMSKVSW